MTNKFYSVAALFLFNAVMYAQVGINTTSPKATLDIKGSNYTPTGTAADDDKATLRIDGGASHTLDMGTTAASPYGAYMQSHSKTGSRSGLPLTLNPNGGNVGVGTLSPQTKFDISTSSNSFGLQHTDGTIQLRSYVGTGSTNNNTDAAWFGTTTNHPLDFMTNNAFRVRIDPTGNVGVGTSTPQKKMHVNGSLQVVNELNVGGNATTAGSAGTEGQVLKSNGPGKAPTWQNLAGVPNATGTVIVVNGEFIVAQEIVVQMTADYNYTASGAKPIGNLNNSIIDNENRYSGNASTNSFKVSTDGVYQITMNAQLITTNGSSPVIGIWNDTTNSWVARANDTFTAPNNNSRQTYTLIVSIPMIASNIYSFRITNSEDVTVRYQSTGSTGNGPITQMSVKRLR